MTDFAELPVEVRSADDSKRVAELVVCRYGETTRRTARPERFLPGAFTDSVQIRDRGRILFTDRHSDGTGTLPSEAKVARPVHWDTTTDPLELRATIRFFDTADGWTTFHRVQNGEIDAGSVGFRPIAERTGADGVREIVEAQMHHFALLSRAETLPAYDAPRVLQVRAAVIDHDLLAVTWDPALAEACIDVDELHKMGSS